MTTHFEKFPIVLAIAVSLSVGRPMLAQTEAQTLENVLVVIADDVGVDQLSCYAEGCDQACSQLPSCDFPNTPNICDRLATNGVLFRNAWSNPSCSPTRSTGMTGRYGFRTGVFVAGNTLPCTEIIPPAIQHDSVSVLPHLLNPDTHLRSYVFSENNQITSTSYQKTTRDDRFKMLRTPNSTAENIEFFDLAGDPSAVPPEPADPFEDVDLYDDASPSLTQVQQDHFEDLQESLNFLAGQIDACPASLSCSLSGTCQPIPSRCVTTNTGKAACVQNSSLFQCPPRQFIRVKNCPCRKSGPGAACRSVDQSWFCQ
jgi:hypothetical protein